jgi:hypothetical protein
MNKEEMLVIVKEWEEAIASLEDNVQSYIELTYAAIDSPLFESVYRIANNYTTQLGHRIGGNEEWLFWYMFDCEMGNKPMEAGCDGNTVLVDSVEKLVDVILMK